MASHKSRPQTEASLSPSAGRLLRALSCDPGGTSGFAICDINKLGEVSIGWDQFKFNESEMTEFMETVVPDLIICEDFEYRNRARAGLNLTPVRMIGVIRLYAQANNRELILQKAMVGKGHYSDHRLRSVGMYERGRPHGRDALRHLLHWLTFKGGNAYVDVVASNFAINIVPLDFFFLDRSFSGNNT